MNAILAGHKGVLCHMDDIFIFGRDQGEHDACLAAALRSIQAAGVTLNAERYCIWVGRRYSQIEKDSCTCLGLREVPRLRFGQAH